MADIKLGRKVAKQIANQNCFWPVTQVMAEKLLVASKRLIRYITLYSMAGVAMETRLFRIHPNPRDTPLDSQRIWHRHGYVLHHEFGDGAR